MVSLRMRSWITAALVSLSLFRIDAGAFGKSMSKAFYKPYRFVQDWAAPVLYVGPSFVYQGKDPVIVSFKLSETSVPGKLYMINTTTNETIYLMATDAPAGFSVDISKITKLKVGAEVVFMYISALDGIPRYTGSSPPGAKYYNTLDSDNNINPALRFGNRWAVAGEAGPNVLEFGFEDGPPDISDMDFNDILFRVQNLSLMVYQNKARKRSYVW